MEKLTDGVYTFSNIVSNQYLLVDQDGLTLIDTGLRGNYRSLLRGIQSLGFKLDDLLRIFITHADLDHFGALHVLKQHSTAAAWTSQPEAEAIEAGRSSRELKMTGGILDLLIRGIVSVSMHVPATKIDRVLNPGQEELSVAGGMIVIDSKGHTPGHVSFYLPNQNILFSGDSIFLKKGKLISSYGINCWDERYAAESLVNQLKLSPKVICGGHGIIPMNSR